MVTSKEGILCEQAKFYYYDLLFQESNRIIPEFITNHLKQCQHCQNQIHQLNRALKKAEFANGLEQIKSDSKISDILKLHFTYLNQPVNCEITKPFLPNLLDPVLTIRIPTPITVHLDHCKECVKDLETIQNLELNRAQLYRLSQLLSDKQTRDKINCKKAQTSIMAFVFMAFSEISEKELNHLCICPECRKALYKFRETIKEELLSKKDNGECSFFDQLPFNKKFDYIVPYGLEPANIKTIETQRSLIFHLGRCPICLTKIQELHKKIYNIDERSESGIVTIYKMTESGQTQHNSRFKDLYADYPINVELAGRRDSILVKRNDSIVNFTAAMKRTILSTNFKSAAKAGFVAAIILVAFILSLNISPAKGINLEQIFSNLENHNNVHISQFSNGKTEPTQERWISNSLNFKLYKTGDELVLWDLTNKEIRMRNLRSEQYVSTPLTNNQIVDLKFSMRDALELFQDMKDLHPNAECKIINQNWNEDTKEYELKWAEENYNIYVYYKLKIFTDFEKDLPFKIESYRKLSVNDEYELRTKLIFKYLSDTEISADRKKYF